MHRTFCKINFYFFFKKRANFFDLIGNGQPFFLNIFLHVMIPFYSREVRSQLAAMLKSVSINLM